MITFEEAYKKVIHYRRNYGTETVGLLEATGRVLALDIKADRDFPPFDRSTKDGIAIAVEALDGEKNQLRIEGVLPAGNPRAELSDKNNCMEIMTGAVVPKGADTVVMYEDINIANGLATINQNPTRGQNIHVRGSDVNQGATVLYQDTKISGAEIGILAAVGVTQVVVKKLPSITLISTGNELVEVEETPLPHQIRKSNMQSLYAALREEGIVAQQVHLNDQSEDVREGLQKALQESDVLLLSGGVSKGKFDFIPLAMEELGVKKIFHKVLQRPGKPFWFGVHKATSTLIFSFPGNPVSTFANYHVYFKDWLKKSLGLPILGFDVILTESILANGTLTLFLGVKTFMEAGKLRASLVTENGSGDLMSLAKSDGFIRLAPRDTPYAIGEAVPFVPARNLIY
ncbi:molybdopterin molybdotransferase MoeA [Flavobacteriaceae bacterium F89]|uniref:Molybdopterin molybdenumtransferase n=1 Tax=Cerina litoralis TaxID=2874477 RepID=A0AAE3ESM8_9FLAO|nr:molybdopterin molybdotransferase MoeA [Cerina litoralis]MCG2460355.1 molybdopterin molybdotransferase MoeA [Cerina litoralis]